MPTVLNLPNHQILCFTSALTLKKKSFRAYILPLLILKEKENLQNQKLK